MQAQGPYKQANGTPNNTRCAFHIFDSFREAGQTVGRQGYAPPNFVGRGKRVFNVCSSTTTRLRPHLWADDFFFRLFYFAITHLCPPSAFSPLLFKARVDPGAAPRGALPAVRVLPPDVAGLDLVEARLKGGGSTINKFGWVDQSIDRSTRTCIESMVCPSIDRLIKRPDPPAPKLAWCTAVQSRGSHGSCEQITDAPHHLTHLLDEDAAEVLEAEVVGPGAVRPQVEVLGQLVAPLSMDGWLIGCGVMVMVAGPRCGRLVIWLWVMVRW